MPTPTGYRNDTNTYGARNTYTNRYNRTTLGRSDIYTGTSTAYDLPRYYPEREDLNTARKSNNTEVRKASAELKKTGASNRTVRKAAFSGGILFALCISVLCRYVAILGANTQITELEKRYNAIIASNQAMQTKIDRQLEMGEIEKYAREELGMMKAESYQKFYIDMKLPDGGTEINNASRAQNAISGVPGTLVNAFRVLK